MQTGKTLHACQWLIQCDTDLKYGLGNFYQESSCRDTPSTQPLVIILASACHLWAGNVWGVCCTCSLASVEGSQLHNCLKAESMPIMRCADMRGKSRRRAYQRAVSVPTPALEQLWASYERFEQSGSNKSLGRQASSSLTC